MEENEARRMFKEENWTDVNSTSVTIKINSAEGVIWEETLRKHLGEPVKNSDNDAENKGVKFVSDFGQGEEKCKMFITIHNPSKKTPNVRTILVQAEKNKTIL